MIINSLSQPPRIVQDYVFCFESGQQLPITIDADLGDTISFGASQIDIQLTEKPFPMNPEQTFPPEHIMIFVGHLNAIHKRPREVVTLSPEQQAEWLQTLKEASGA